MRKQTSVEEPISGAEADAAIDAIIQKQSMRLKADERYKEQLERFKLADNDETSRLLKTIDKVNAKSFVVGHKMTKLKKLNERGFRQLQVIKAVDDHFHEGIGARHSSVSVKPSTAVTSPVSTMREATFDYVAHRIEDSVFSPLSHPIGI